MNDRANQFRYLDLEITHNALIGHYELDNEAFREVVTFSDQLSLSDPAIRAVAELWFLVAGLSYYKSGAPRLIDLGDTPITSAGRELVHAALIDGLGEFAFRNHIDLSEVQITGGVDAATSPVTAPAHRVVTPFGGGIDSVVSVTSLPQSVNQALFIVSPPSGTYEPLEATAQLTGLPILRATRELDPAIFLSSGRLNGHVPVTAMITLLAVIAALADNRGGVVMSNEHSASSPNVIVNGRAINHQWSKSWLAEQLLASAVAERIGDQFVVASYLRDRSELWVAQQFAAQRPFHATFRSCNRAFKQRASERAETWCGECDKCLFIHLVLAPFMSRVDLATALGVEPLADPKRYEQLRTLVGLGTQRKPFECVGDPTECAVALATLHTMAEWRDLDNVAVLAPLLDIDETLADLLQPQGVNRVPAAWL